MDDSKRPLAVSGYFSRFLSILYTAFSIYIETDGEQRAASFAYYAFFALFPLLTLLITVGSIFVTETRASSAVIEYISAYVPVGPDGQNLVVNTVQGIIKSRRGVGTIAVVGIIWSSLGFFHALVRGVNRAWGTMEIKWWRLPVKNFGMIGIVVSALFLGIFTPAVLAAIREMIDWSNIEWSFRSSLFSYRHAQIVLQTLVLFYGFSMFYVFAPNRKTRFAEVWVSALTVAVMLQVLQHLIVLYVRNYSQFNRVYGAFGGVIVLLMWIYLSGSIILFGACLAAASARLRQGAVHSVEDPSNQS